MWIEGAHGAAGPCAPCRALAEYVQGLVARLGEADAAALARLRAVVGDRRARIVLGDEAILVRFRVGALEVVPDRPRARVQGEGATDRATVLDLLDGYLEIHEAVLSGRLRVRGAIAEVERMFVAIEILLDAATRAPALQALARDYRRDPCLPAPADLFPGSRRAPRGSAHDPWEVVLARLDLMP